MSESEAFNLAHWYPSEIAKRNLGKICEAILIKRKTVHLLGTETEPLLVLGPPPVKPDDVEISIDEARADWSNVTLAAAIYGTRFRIQGRRSTPTRRGLVHAILSRHPKARHPVERYQRSTSPDANRLAQQMETLASEIRKLGQKLSFICTTGCDNDLTKVTDRLERSADLIDRRFRDLWRLSNSYRIAA